MNLVQINERLKDLPMQVIQQYANGMNPEVPPYLALGELQRREMAQKQMANAQGASQGPQPSIKEQVEQKAGLMQLQQMQQQQMMQQMQQPRGPMPVPPGAPQPQAQPEMAMARGGLTGIPVRSDMFEYADGGIVAFQAGGQPKYETRFDAMTRRNRGELTPEERAEADAKKPRVINLPKGTSRQDADMVQMQNPDAQVVVEGQGDVLKDLISRFQAGQAGVKKGLADAFTYSSDVEAAKNRREPPVSAPAPQAPPVRRMSPPEVAKMLQDPYAAGKPTTPTTDLPAALADATGAAGVKPPPPVGQPPAAMPPAAPTGLPAALTGAPPAATIPVSPDRAELEALMKSQQREAPTAAGVISGVSELMPAGMQDEAMKKRFAEQRARAEGRQAAYDSSRPTGLQNLIRVLGQAGQFKGMSGIAPAYTSLQQQQRAEDMAMQRQQDELMTAIESREYGADKDVFTARTGAMDKAQTLFGQSQKSILEAAAAKLGADQGRLDKQSQINMQRDLEEFKAIQDRELKGMDIAQRERESKRVDARSPAVRAAEYVALRQRARAEAAKGTPAGTAAATELNAQAEDLARFSPGSSGSGEENAGTRSLRTALEAVNKRLELMGPDEPDYAALKKDQKDLSDQLVNRALGEAGAGGGASEGEVDKENPLLKKK